MFSDQPAKDAAAAQTAGLNKGFDYANSLYGAGNTALTTNFGKAGDLYTGLQKGTQAGADAYGDATGANGPEGLARAKALFTASPGYQSGFDLLTGANDRNAASRGMLGSGNTIADTAKLATDYSNNKFGDYASRLAPYLGANANAVGGGAGVATGVGTALNANDIGLGTLGFNKEAGIGNANANADLAKYGISANMISALLKVAGLGTSVGGSGGFAGMFGSGGSGSPMGWAPNPNGGGTSPMFG